MTGAAAGAAGAHGAARGNVAAPVEAQGFGPLAASAAADAIMSFWEIARARGEIDPDQPLDLLDLMPGRGVTVWLMLQALRQRIASLPDFKPRLRYLAAAAQRPLLAQLRSQEELRPWIADGILVPVLWDPERGDPCLLALAGRSAWFPLNPVVVLAHNRWSTLAQRLFAVHYGALLEADIGQLARTPKPESKAGLWRPATEPQLSVPLGELINVYLSQFNSAPVPLPVGALAVIDRIAALASRGYLVMATAPGATSERKLRLSHFGAVVNDFARDRTVPVNFHLLGHRFRDLGAAVWQRDLYGDMATQVALGGMAGAADRLPRVVRALAKGSLGGAPALADAMRALRPGGGLAGLNTMLALLRQSEHDPDVFSAAGNTLLDGLHANPDCNREAWSEALEQVWQNHLAAPDAPALHRQLAQAAMHVGDWALARRALRRGMTVHGENAGDLAHLAWIEARTGGIVAAGRMARRALALDQESRTAREVVSRIGARLAAWDGIWGVEIRHPSLPLVLEPLDVSHAEALLHQYRDPQIAVMTGLLPLATLEEARKWIAEHSEEPGRRAYAVMHADHGFVGYVCLSVSALESYFCFWIGVDFQGRRFAGEAARMACGFARERGIVTIFTSAYDDNTRSIRALERIGFIPLAVRALPPENDRLFMFMRTGGDAPGDPVAELIDYYEREKLPISFVPREQRAID